MLYQLEYPLNSSIKILYERLSTISGLSEWFADDVTLAEKVFTPLLGKGVLRMQN